MSNIHPVADDSAVRQMFAMLYGDDMEVNAGSPVEGDKTLVAVYLNDEDKPVCACLSDYHCAAFMGSALSRIPVGGAEDAAESGDFSEMMMGNFQEAMNIASRFFMDADSPHLRLSDIHTSIDSAPDDVKAMLDACQGRQDFRITIPNYGDGGLSLVAT